MDRDEDGRFVEGRSDEDVLDAVAVNAPAATAEVADALGLTRQAADYRLRQLREAGRVESKMIGSALAWSLPADRGASGPTSPKERADTSATGDTEPAAERDDDPDPEALEERIRALDPPGSGTSLDKRVAATVRVVEHLEETGATHAEVLKDLLDDDEVGYADVGSYWANFIRGEKVLKQLPEVETPGKGEKIYRVRGSPQ